MRPRVFRRVLRVLCGIVISAAVLVVGLVAIRAIAFWAAIERYSRAAGLAEPVIDYAAVGEPACGIRSNSIIIRKHGFPVVRSVVGDYIFGTVDTVESISMVSVHHAAFDHLPRFGDLRNVYVGSVCPTVDQIERLTQCHKIEFLFFENTARNDDSLGYLAKLPRLRFLALVDEAEVTDVGVGRLVECEHLENLWLMGVPMVRPDIARSLPQFSKLRFISFAGDQFDDTVLGAISEAGKLESVFWQSKSLRDEAMQSLAMNTGLEQVIICEAPLTMRGIHSLKALPCLKLLTLRDTKISEADLPAVEKMLPNCKCFVGRSRGYE